MYKKTNTFTILVLLVLIAITTAFSFKKEKAVATKQLPSCYIVAYLSYNSIYPITIRNGGTYTVPANTSVGLSFKLTDGVKGVTIYDNNGLFTAVSFVAGTGGGRYYLNQPSNVSFNMPPGASMVFSWKVCPCPDCGQCVSTAPQTMTVAFRAS